MRAKVLIVAQGGKHKYVNIPVKLLATDGEAVLRMLEAKGLEINSEPGARELVLEYLRSEITRGSGGPAN